MDNKQEQLRARAYGIWQAEGEPHGRDREHWDMAKLELATPGSDEAEAEASVTPAEENAAPTPKLEAEIVSAAKPKPRKPRGTKPA